MRTLKEKIEFLPLTASSFAVLSASILIFLTSCQTTPTKFEDLQRGKWQAKMLVRDIKAEKSHIVNLDIIAIRPDKMRIEVTTPIGIHLASLAMNNGQMQTALPKQKRFITGRATEEGLKSALGIAIDPQLFMHLLFDDAPVTKDWTCIKNTKGFLELCDNKRQGLNIQWKDREVSRRRVEVESRTYKLQLSLQGFSTKVEDSPEQFSISVPSGFKSEKLN